MTDATNDGEMETVNHEGAAGEATTELGADTSDLLSRISFADEDEDEESEPVLRRL